MPSSFLGLFSSDMAIDLGTSHTLIHVRGRGVVCREPTIIAFRQARGGQRQVVAVGSAAKAMLGRTPADIQAIRPLKDGVIADFEAAEAMLRILIHRALGRTWVGSRALVSLPFGTTEVEKRAVRESAEAAGARVVLLIEEPLAAALGAELPITEPCGNMIVDIGGGTTEVAILSMGGIVFSRSVRVGGDHMDEAIIRYLEDRRRMLVGPRTAEEVKIRLGRAILEGDEPVMGVKGRDLENGFPRAIEVSAKEVREALDEPLQQILGAILGALEHTPPELASDIVEQGIVLTGGGSLMPRLDELIRQRTGLPVVIAEDPLSTVVLGSGRVLEHLDRYRRFLV